ncbi:alpha amylase C-terminal domain-containing protein [Luteolibacter pohnpeiensis]|uniref:1,4-alpha-glucan branching enzyme n=1 Tax=Luteolibacter pohnpeiensis TaxID=454153 RepID=A0A934VVM7_9BACT|nr:alpha-amylase family glycosyl hydrolase [Luteolibacter pohnpeiensis]MBK1883717.1 alpha amylase C-terminal domain-containing protein [Luteolibacter pohnpeiensis]
MPDQPQLIKDDPWLEPFEAAIQNRLDRFTRTLGDIESSAGSLAAYATGHKFTGVHFQPSAAQWMIREWAPAAKAVSLIGDFNGWNRETHPLAPAGGGVWQLRLPADSLKHGQRVKLHIVGADGSRRDRIPACIRRAVQDPASNDYSGQIWNPPEPYVWQHRFDPSVIEAPLIYETHVGMAGEEPRIHTYREFADQILPRIVAAGYNTIQLMAVQEHPYYGSFGYHVSSFFAPCSRFGTPEDLKYLIDTAHGLNLAVLLDIVHSHAVKNTAEGLNDFDGSGNQYFHHGGRGDHPQWDSKCFDYSKPEVRQFLLSNVRYWLEEFRFDGFRFDGVTSMLYHSHGNKAFGDYGDYFGGDADDDAILYLQLAAKLIQDLKPGAIAVAEDMSGMPGLCRPLPDGGIGFTHRLAMGIPDHWIKLLKHTRDEDWDLGELWGVLANRRFGEATIAYAESHDQALVGDKTLAFRLMDKEMYWHMGLTDPDPIIERGIALHKMIRLITLAIGGEGWLNFMGNEFGHPEWLDFPREGNGWSYHYCRRQWSLVDSPNLKYQWLAAFDRELMKLATDRQLLSAAPAQLLYLDHEKKLICAERANLIFVLNFSTDGSYFGYPLQVPGMETRRIVLDTDQPQFGGHGRIDADSEYPVQADGIMQIYSPSRSGLVFAKIQS